MANLRYLVPGTGSGRASSYEVCNADSTIDTAPLCKQMSVLKIEDLFTLNLSKFYFKYMHNELPCYQVISSLFKSLILSQTMVMGQNLVLK